MQDLTKGAVGKQIFLFALPMVLGNILQQLYSIADSVIVGRFIGKEALGAVGASFPIIYVLIAMVIGIGSGATVVISQYFGAKDIERVKRTISTIFIFLFISSIVVSISGYFLSGPIFRLIGVPEDVFPDAMKYFRIYVSGQVFFFGYNGVTSVLRGLGDSRTPLVFTIMSVFLNIVLDLIFVVVLDWGIAGVAYATLIAHGISFLSAAIYLNMRHEIISFALPNMKFDFILFKESLRIGLPTGFQQTFVAMGMMAILGIVSKFGTGVLAAYTVAARIDSIASMPAMNFGSALSAFVGQNIGAGESKRVIQGHRATVFLAAGVSALVSVMVVLFDEQLMRLFTTDPEVITEGVRYLRIVCSFYVLFAIMFTFHGLFRGAGDTIVPMFVTLISLWLIRIPLAYFLSDILGVNGIWWSVPIAWAAGLIFSIIYYRTGRWKRKSLVSNR